MPVPTLTFPNLVKAMEGKNTLHGWDVLVSYDEDMVNTLLAARSQQTGLMEPIVLPPFSYIDDFSGDTITANVTLQITKLKLQFLDSSSSVELLLPFTGQEVLTLGGNTKSKDIPPGYRIRVVTSLQNLSGTISADGNFEADTSAVPVPAGEIAIYPTSGLGAYGVCLDFRNTIVQIEVDTDLPDSGATPGQAVKMNGTLAAIIQADFQQSQHLKVYLAATSNKPAAVANSTIVFQPEAFTFTCEKGDKDQGIKSTLCTWMTLKGSGAKPEGYSQLTFEVGNPQDPKSMMAASPLPKGSSASVVISHDAFTNLFVSPALQNAKGFTSVTSTSSTGTSGMSFDLGMTSQVLGFPAYEWHSWDRSLQDKGDALSIDTSKTAAKFTLQSGIMTKSDPRATFSYVTPQNTVSFSSSHTSRQGTNTNSAEVKMGFQLTGSVSWGDTTTENPSLGLTIAQQFTANNTVNTDIGFWASLCGQGSYPPYVKLSDLSAPVDVNLGRTALPSLDILLTTNLIFPGQHVFIGHKVLAESDQSDTGMAVPRDVVLTGSLASSLSAKHTARVNHLRALRPSSLGAASVSSETQNELLEEFKNDVWNSDDLSLFFAVSKACTSDDKMAMTNMLASKGFGDLTPELLLSGMGLDLGQLLDGDTGLKDKAISSKSDIDLRYFGGLYSITSPSADAGKLILINPFTKTIKMMGVDVSPVQQVDPDTGRKTNEFVLTAAGKEYHIFVEAAVDGDKGTITPSLSGKISGDKIDAFAADWKEVIVVDPSNDQTSQRTGPDGTNRDKYGLSSFGNLLKDGQDESLILADPNKPPGWFFRLISLICCCCPCAKHAAVKKGTELQPQSKNAAASESNARLVENDAQAHALSIVEERQSESFRDQSEENNRQARETTFDSRMSSIDTVTEDLSDQTIREILDAMDEGEDSVWNHEAFQRNVKDSIEITRNRQMTLAMEQIAIGFARDLEDQLESVGLSHQADYIDWAEQTLDLITEKSVDASFAEGSQAVLELVNAMGTSIAQRRQGETDSLEDIISQEEASSESLKKDVTEAEKSLEEAIENKESAEEIESLEKTLEDLREKEKTQEEKINKDKSDSEEKRNESKEAREHADKYPEEKKVEK